MNSTFLAHQDIPHEQQIQALPTVMAELQRRVLKAESTVGQKERENATLREQLQQYEARWLEYETKMKSMEEMWQKQMSSLQVSCVFKLITACLHFFF